MRNSIFVLVVAFLVPAAYAQNDSCLLGDGTLKKGTVLGVFRDGVRFQETGAAEFTLIPFDRIQGLSTEGPVNVSLASEEKVRGKITGYDAKKGLTIASAGLGAVAVSEAAIITEPPAPPSKTDAPKDQKKTLLVPKDWYGHVALSASLATGNSDVFAAILDVEGGRVWEENELLLKLKAIYGRSNGEKDNDSQTILGRFAHHYDEELYSYAQVEAGRDDIKSIELRLLPNVGAGYKVWYENNDKLLSLEAGVGMIYETFADDTETRTDPTARFGVRYHEMLFSDVSLHQTAEIVVPVTDVGSYLARSETVISVPISTSWSMRTTLQIEYQANPAGGRKSTDVLATIGLEYRF